MEEPWTGPWRSPHHRPKLLVVDLAAAGGLIHPQSLLEYTRLHHAQLHHASSISNFGVTVFPETIQLTQTEREVISLGPRFIPTPPSTRTHMLHLHTHTTSQLASFTRRIKLADYFTLHHRGPISDNSIDPARPSTWRATRSSAQSQWQPPTVTRAVDTAVTAIIDDVNRRLAAQAAAPNAPLTRQPSIRHDNLTPKQHHAARGLATRTDIVVCDVDKGGGVVVLDADVHRHAVNSHLHDVNTYQPVSDPVEVVLQQWQQLCRTTMIAHLGMDSARADAILRDTAIPSFYVIIKLHKLVNGMAVPPSRPIAAAFNSPARYASDVCVRLLQPLVHNDDWTLQSTRHLLRWIERNNVTIPPTAYLLTLDVTALYPSMPVIDTVNACVTRFCRVNGVSATSRAVTALRALMHCVLDNSYVVDTDTSSDATTYRQISGLSMGISLAPAAANIFVGSCLAPVLDRFSADIAHRHNRTAPVVIKRCGFIDDIFCVVDATHDELQELLQRLNSAHHCIRLEPSFSQQSVHFLDVTISKGRRWQQSGCLLDTCLYEKPTNRFTYIPWTSYHSEAARTGYISGEARRYVMLSSSEEDALEAARRFTDRLRARGYPMDTVLKELGKVQYKRRQEYIFSDSRSGQTVDDTRTVPFILPQCPLSLDLGIGDIIKRHLRPLRHLRPVIAWTNARNLGAAIDNNRARQAALASAAL